MLRRVLTSFVLLSVVSVGLTVEALDFVIPVLISFIALWCTEEMSAMLVRKHLRVYRRVASWGVAALLLNAYFAQMEHVPALLGLICCGALLVRMFGGKVEGSLSDVAATTFTALYVGLPTAIALHFYEGGAHGRALLLLTMVIIWSTDTCALFAGKAFGRTRLWPKISPGKTWEGSLGGVAGALVAAAVSRSIAPETYAFFSDAEMVFFALFFSIVSQFGDLAESLLKRDVGVKDSGTGLTGHGGFLDLVDSMLFTMPVLLAYVQFFHPTLLVYVRT